MQFEGRSKAKIEKLLDRSPVTRRNPAPLRETEEAHGKPQSGLPTARPKLASEVKVTWAR
jgi:hypothetical protein